MTTLQITGGRIIDPSQGIDRVGNLLIRDGRIVSIDDKSAIAEQQIDARGKIVAPGLIDMHVSHREPGDDDEENTASATAAALAGGFTSIVCMPDTDPAVDNRAAAEFVLLQAERAKNCHVYPLGAITKGCEGKELAEIGQLVECGAMGFSDGVHPVANAELMRRAMEYASMFDRPIFAFPQVPEMIDQGVMHEGFNSTLLGLKGMPATAEEIMVARDIALAELAGARLHLICLSTSGGLALVRGAKQKGIRVTCEVTPHHLALTDESLRSFDSNYKVIPPLRPQEHIDALLEGLKDGTIDAIASDHQPFASETKDRELDLVPFGIVGLETLLPICIKTLIEPQHLDWSALLSRLTENPAKILGIEKGTLQPGRDADVTIIDPDVEYTIDSSQFRSHSSNSPFHGWKVKGRAETVIVGGEIRFSRNSQDS